MSSKIPNLLERNCPNCDSMIKYSNKYNRNNAEKDKRLCKTCSNTEAANKPENKEKMSKLMTGENNPMYNMTGSLNHFYGKTHTQKVKNIMSKKTSKRFQNMSKKDLQKFKEVCKIKSNEYWKKKSHPFKGKSFEEIYGKERASIIKEKISKSSSGQNNPMYGISPSKNSGSGWSGWYNGWYFRSLRELSYMINVIERFNLNWESGEVDKYKIPYIFNNSKKTYKPDFIIENKYMVEIKPKKLHNVKEVIEKKKAGVKFCSKNNLIYKLTDVPILNKREFIELEKKNLIKFNSKYKQKLYNY